MSEDLMLKCLIAFILGWLLCRMMGNGFRVGGNWFEDELKEGRALNEHMLDVIETPSPPRRCTLPTSVPGLSENCGNRVGCLCGGNSFVCAHPNYCCEGTCADD